MLIQSALYFVHAICHTGSNDIIIEFDNNIMERKYFLPKALHNATNEDTWHFWQEKKRAEELLNQAIENNEVSMMCEGHGDIRIKVQHEFIIHRERAMLK
ncbi:hypothetical protein EON65_52655 [archaeon]|nr:MAG: hypothetical protein EON65_52655 [archaeon]